MLFKLHEIHVSVDSFVSFVLYKTIFLSLPWEHFECLKVHQKTNVCFEIEVSGYFNLGHVFIYDVKTLRIFREFFFS